MKMKNRDNPPSDSIEEYFKRALAIPLVDSLIMELNCRFSNVSKDVIKLLHLVPHVCANDNNDDFKLQTLVELYEDDLLNPILVEYEYQVRRRKWKGVEEIECPQTLAQTIKAMDEQMFPNLFILVKIACVLPVTSCECERSFSCLRRLREIVQLKTNGIIWIWSELLKTPSINALCFCKFSFSDFS